MSKLPDEAQYDAWQINTFNNAVWAHDMGIITDEQVRPFVMGAVIALAGRGVRSIMLAHDVMHALHNEAAIGGGNPDD